MANSFWNFVSQFTAGTLAKAEDVNTNFSGVAAGLDAVETETDQAIKVANSAGVTDVVLNAAARANKLLAFDASGDVIASQILGVWKGAHADAAGTDYQVRDVVRDDAGSIQLGSLYICNNTHTSTGSLLTDTANWDILVDATDLTTLGGFTAAQYLRSDADDTFTGILTIAGTIVGVTSVTATDFVGDLTGDLTGDVTGNADTVTTNANLTGPITSSGNATTVDVSAITGQTDIGTDIAGTDELLINDGGNLRRTDMSRVRTYNGIAAQVTDHIRAGNTQLWDGTGVLSQFSDLINILTISQSTFETVGKTSSGADNEWTEMDQLPASATTILLNVSLTAHSAASGLFSLSFCGCSADVASPTIATNGVQQVDLLGDADAANETWKVTGWIMLPLSTTQTFKIAWLGSNITTANCAVTFNYRGFMTD